MLDNLMGMTEGKKESSGVEEPRDKTWHRCMETSTTVRNKE